MTLQRATNIAAFALRFARVERVTRHEDGVRPETDSDHSIMLALVACDLAPEGLNRNRVAAFAVVHDLVEAYAGDTQTLSIDAAGRVAKADREKAAMARIREEFSVGPLSWMVSTMDDYERQAEHEARYVRLMDKVLPKLTHLFNGCVAARGLTTREGFVAAHREQHAALSNMYGGDFWVGPILDLLREAMTASEMVWTE